MVPFSRLSRDRGLTALGRWVTSAGPCEVASRKIDHVFETLSLEDTAADRRAGATAALNDNRRFFGKPYEVLGQASQEAMLGLLNSPFRPLGVPANVDQVNLPGFNFVAQILRRAAGKTLCRQPSGFHSGQIEGAGNLFDANFMKHRRSRLELMRTADQIGRFFVIDQPARPSGEHRLRDVDRTGDMSGGKFV